MPGQRVPYQAKPRTLGTAFEPRGVKEMPIRNAEYAPCRELSRTLDLQPHVVPMAARVPHALTANLRGSLDAVGHGEKSKLHESMETDSELTFTSAG